MTEPTRRIVDADEHYYEPDDCFTRYLEPAHRGDAVHVRRDGHEAPGQIFVGEEPCWFHPRTLADAVPEPGAVHGAETGSGRLTVKAAELEWAPVEVLVPEAVDREARLEALDAQGIDGAVLFPTMALTPWWQLARLGPDAFYANLRSFNRWLADDWGYGQDRRLFGAPVVSPFALDRGVAELDRCLDAGARVVQLLPAFPRLMADLGDPEYAPFWARLDEAGVLVGFHGSNGGHQEQYRSGAEPKWQMALTPFEWLLLRDGVTHSIAALVLGGVFSAFPKLRFASVENGAFWLPHLLESVDRAANASHVPWSSTDDHRRPSEVIAEHVYLCPFDSDDLDTLIATVGADHVLFGSDYPHPEGLARPLAFRDALAAFDDDVDRLVMGANVASLLGYP